MRTDQFNPSTLQSFPQQVAVGGPVVDRAARILTFSPIQDSIATRMELERTTILARYLFGGAMGDMVAIHSIAAVSSVLGLGNREGEIHGS